MVNKQVQYTFCPISHVVKTKKLGQLSREIFFFKNHVENKAGRLVPDLFLLYKKG